MRLGIRVPLFYRGVPPAATVWAVATRIKGGLLRARLHDREALSRRFSPHADLAGEVVRALAGMQQWTEQFASTSASLGPTFEKVAAERPMADLLADCELALANIERISDALSRALRIVDMQDPSLNGVLEWLRTRARIEELE